MTSSLTFVRYWRICLAALLLWGTANLLPLVLQKSSASLKLSWGSVTNQNSAPSTKTDDVWYPSGKDTKNILVADRYIIPQHWHAQLKSFSGAWHISNIFLVTFGHYQGCTRQGSLLFFLLKHKKRWSEVRWRNLFFFTSCVVFKNILQISKLD